MTQDTRLVVTVAGDAGGALLRSAAGDIRIASSAGGMAAATSLGDSAAWLFLPVAMRLNRKLHIEAEGSAATVANARRMSEIWQSWLPGHFSASALSFARTVPRPPRGEAPPRDLLFLSGGLDAAYSGLRRLQAGRRQDLVTIRGMDYGLADTAAFDALLNKTQAFAASLGDRRIVVECDAYTLYRKIHISRGRSHIGHAFVLAGAGFLHSGGYENLVLAADERLDGQFVIFPWGTNSATNPLFHDGRTGIVSDGDDAARGEKVRLVAQSPGALQSLSFCWNARIRPGNCGVCPKCVRTKLLFAACTGSVPPIFFDDTLPPDWLERLRYRQRLGLFAAQEIFNAALEFGHAAAVPGFESARNLLERHVRRRTQRSAWRRALAKLFRRRRGR